MLRDMQKTLSDFKKHDREGFIGFILFYVCSTLAVIYMLLTLSSCSIKEVNLIEKVIIGCVCNDGTIPIYRPDILTEKSFNASSLPCRYNGGIKEFIYKN